MEGNLSKEFFVVSWYVMSSDGPKELERCVMGDGVGQRSCLSLSCVANLVFRTAALWSLSLSPSLPLSICLSGGSGGSPILLLVDASDAGEDVMYGAHCYDWYVLSWHDGEGCIGCRKHRRSKGEYCGVLRGVCAPDA